MITRKKKKLPPVQDWTLNAGFYSVEVNVKARTKGEARKKAMEKLNKMPVQKFICKNTTYLDKRY